MLKIAQLGRRALVGWTWLHARRRGEAAHICKHRYQRMRQKISNEMYSCLTNSFKESENDPSVGLMSSLLIQLGVETNVAI